MPTANNKRIEETATTALKFALLKCPILESHIDSNDRTPSWDGTVFVYQNSEQKKKNLIGRVPIQVKGTEKSFPLDIATYPCNVTDLKNYYNDGGCVFFLISVNPSTGKSRIFYSSLLVFDLKKLIDKAGNQQSLTIKLSLFPTDKINEISTIFISFVENSRKQISFIGKELKTLEQLEKNGVEIESLTFNTSGIGLNSSNIGDFISSHDFYLYAKPQGLDIEIPVDKVKNATFARPIDGKVCVKDIQYYDSYYVVSKKGKSFIRIGKGIKIVNDEEKQKITINFKPVGTLSDYITDGKFFIAVAENKDISINNAKLSFNDSCNINLEEYKEQLQYYEDVKKMLDILGVNEELQLDNLSQADEINIKNFVNAILYNKKITFSIDNKSPLYGAFKISNLSIWIWADKKEDGYYQVESFFTSQKVVAFDNTDTEHAHPIPASSYLLLTKNAFIHTSNIDYEKIKSDVCSMKHHPLLLDGTMRLFLNILLGYDEQKKKNHALLDLANSVCEWLSGYKKELDSRILRLNQLQIIKRKRNYEVSELLELGKLSEDTNPFNIRCGAYILLEDNEKAQRCFDKLSKELQEEFKGYPIYNLWNRNKKLDD